MSITFSARQAPPGRISLAGVQPLAFANRTLKSIEQQEVLCANKLIPLGDLFRISGSIDETIYFEGANALWDDVGRGLASGHIEVHGEIGDFLGRDMTGGTLNIFGNVGAFAASSLAGGTINILGDVGARLAAAPPWLAAGMRGGRVFVDGNVGERCGEKMRRGELIISGSCGNFLATRMVAGTIAVLGSVGTQLGFGLRRGTLWLRENNYIATSGFVETAQCADVFIELALNEWRKQSVGTNATQAGLSQQAIFRELGDAQVVRRYMGDCSGDGGGRGEIFLLAATSSGSRSKKNSPLISA